MGKKVEKALANKEKASSATVNDDDNPNKTPEPYKCIGNFLTDFNELCKQNGMSVIPAVVTRPKPPGATTGVNEGKADKKADKGKPAAVPEPEPEPELDESGEPVEPPPKTYTTKDKFEYFKPSVQVEMDNNDKWDTVTEVYIRGWKIDNLMMDTFMQSWPTLERLHTINLWYTGISEGTLHTLSTFLPNCSNVKNVVLDGNPVKEENWAELIGEDSLIQNLSLRNCRISCKGAAGIGRSLGTAKTQNTKLLSLNLMGNDIADAGAESLAGGLRMNRTLMSLTLTNNKIADKGSEKIAEALSRFPLSHEEVVARRRLISDRGSPERNRSESDEDVKGKDSKEDTKTQKKEKEDTRAGSKRASVAADAKNQGKTKDKKGKTGKSSLQDADNLDTLDQINPLLEVADYMEGELWIAGNRTLINLNLSRNEICEPGVAALLKAVQYQTTLCLDNRSGGTGLMRLIMNKNPVPPENEVLIKLNEKMMMKDPFYKPPATPEGETAS